MSYNMTIQCLVQNRLGALDRVLSAFTHRGIVPGQILFSQDEEDSTSQMTVSFACDDDKSLEKLVKCLQKQVYVLDAWSIPQDVELNNVTELFATEHAKRRITHAHA